MGAGIIDGRKRHLARSFINKGPKMKKTRSIAILSAFIFLAGASEALACRCFGRPQGVKGIQTCGYYWNSESIFIGLAEKVEIDNNAGWMKVTFSVERSVRGTNAKSVEVFTNASTAGCGYPFEQGERYFVYGRKGSDGKLQEGLCGPTTLLKDAEDDLEYAKAIEDGKLGTRIWGRVFEDRQPEVTDKRAMVPLPGIEITIKNDKYTFKTFTDENGDYLFKDFPRGPYQVKELSTGRIVDNSEGTYTPRDFTSYLGGYRVFAQLPNGYKELFPREDLTEHFAGGCSGVNFRVTRQGSIRGKVINFPSTTIRNPWDRDEVQQPKVSLIALDENNQTIPHRAYDEKWAYREKFEYYFDFVPAGRYLLAMNPGNCPYPNNGVPPTYFPGVADRSKARIITVRDGEHLILENFRSLPLLKKRSFSGVVLNSDKTPAENVTVRLTDKEFPICNGLSIETKTDGSGRFQLRGFEGYGYKISAYAENSKGQPRPHAEPFSLPQSGPVEGIQLLLDQNY